MSQSVLVRIAALALICSMPLAQAQVETAEVSQGALAKRCESARAKLKEATDPSRQVPERINAELWCECMPAKISRLEGMSGNPQQAKAAVTEAFENCMAGITRKELDTRCREKMRATKPQREELYCGCLKAEVDKLSDKIIWTEALKMHARKKAEREAQAEGRTLPPPAKSLFEETVERCNAKIK